MKSDALGTDTLNAEVKSIAQDGFWLFLDGKELFLSFKEFPWFKQASVSAIQNVERPCSHHLYWPDLDVDLEVESIEHPERYPLLAKSVSCE